MRQQLIAGNWKMNLNRAAAVELAKAVAERAAAYKHLGVALCPPAVYLEAVGKAIAGSQVALGAQNMYGQPKGAFTGEISASMLVDVGCKYVILGHSERRQYFVESSELVNEKVFAALDAGLIPIVCLGETWAQREAKKTDEVIRRQFDGSFSAVSAEQMCRVVIAYEPVWAIGTGKKPTLGEAQAVHAALRRIIETRYNKQVAETVQIQYGGSVKPDEESKTLLACAEIDGALVGGASLKIDDFMGIIDRARKVGPC